MVSLLQIARSSSQVSPLSSMEEDSSKWINVIAKEDSSKWINVIAKEEPPVIESIERDIVKTPSSESDYFSFFDSTPLSFFEDDIEEEDTPYEIFTDGLQISAVNAPYVLEEVRFEENYLVDSKRFIGDIIFMLNNSKILEYSVIGLTLCVIGSLYLLPSGFDVSASLLLSAPLFVSLCGLFAKYFKRNN